MFTLDNLALARLVGVHPDLVKVVNDCARNGVMPFEFSVSCGLRTIEQERHYVAIGASETMKSRHLDGHAVDLVVIRQQPPLKPEVIWAWPVYQTLAVQMKAAADRVKVPITWGGDWVHFKDGSHFELPWDKYPSGAPIA